MNVVAGITSGQSFLSATWETALSDYVCCDWHPNWNYVATGYSFLALPLSPEVSQHHVLGVNYM